MARAKREITQTPAERRAQARRADEAYRLRRRDASVDPELLLAAVVWPSDPQLRTLDVRFPSLQVGVAQ